MNEKLFSYFGSFGTHFSCARCDFKAPLLVIDAPTEKKHFLSDVAEMIGYHATNIRPELNGFQGYDCIDFQL